jgi:predicted transposase/invertase (TIGR01784 family)
MSDLLDPKMDYIFKTIFGVDDRKPLLVSFLNALFKGNPHVENITLENTDIPKILKTNKSSRLDVKASIDNGKTKIDVEIQCNNTGEIPERAFQYLSGEMPKMVHTNESYNGPKVIGIWILGENVTNRQNAVSDAYMTWQPNGTDPYEIMTDSARIIFIELPKFNPKNADAKDVLTAWLAFLKDPVLMDKVFLQDKTVQKAMETLQYISADDDVRAIADLRQKTINDHNSEMTVAREEGKAEGEAKKARETAIAMLAKGLDPELIADCTGLSVGEVNDLRQS